MRTANRRPAHSRLGRAVLCGSVLGLALTACSSGSAQHPAAKSNFSTAQVTTAPGSKPLAKVVWSGDYRAPYSEDPVKIADYPEETILGNVCEPVIHVGADYRMGPGIAKSWSQPDARHLVLELDPRAAFSDGSPVTTQDVVYSLVRNQDPATASNFADAYKFVTSVKATGEHEVTVTFSKDDYIFVRNLGTLAAAVVKKSFAQQAGQNFGTAKTGVLCTGPYTVASFDGTNTMVLKRNTHYWNPEHAAKVDTLEFRFLTDPQGLVNALNSGTVQGAFNLASTMAPQLTKSTAGKFYIGGEGSTTQNVDLIVSRFTGGLGDARVRQALSLALDRATIAKTIYSGAADPLYATAGPGFWNNDPAKSDYEVAYRALSKPADVAGAKQLLSGAKGLDKEITLGYPAGTPNVPQLAQVIQQTGQAIGLKIKIVGLPAQQYGNLFTDPKARAGLDSFLTINYMEFPEAAIMYESYGLPYGIQNFNGYSNPQVTQALQNAQGTKDPSVRASFVISAQQTLAEDLPWIPIVAPRALLFQNKGVTGAPLTFSYMDNAWASALGAP